MEKIKSNQIKFIITILSIIIVSTITGTSFATDAAIYTSKLKKGDNLEFTGETWDVYKTKAEAQSIAEGKHPTIKRTIKNGEKITILSKDGNTLKIKKDEYIYYGSNAKKYFTNTQEKKKTEIIQNNNKQKSTISLNSKNKLTVPVYTSKLTKGENFKFTGKTWNVYKTKAEAQSIEEGKHPTIKRTIKNGEKITILSKDGNTLKIKKDEYIYYGLTAKNYFIKVKANDDKTEKKQNAQNNKSKNNTKKKNERCTDGDYYIVNNSVNDVLKNVGPQNPGECLKYACKYANYVLGNKSTQYHLIGSENKISILKVVASEINAGRPVVARAETEKKTKVNGKDMCGRHFVTIVGIKKNADLNDLSESDFLILDPYKAKKKKLSARHLLRGDHDLKNYKTTKIKGYAIGIFTTTSKYTKNIKGLKTASDF